MLSILHSFGELGATIHKELAPVPGRSTTLWRYLIASAIVIVVSMALQVPFLALSLIAIFSTTLQNTFLTRLSGMLATIGLTLAVACTLLLLRLTLDVPFLRILCSMLILLGAMYFLRTNKLGGMGFLVGLAVIYTQSAVDTVSNPELLTRAVLYLWVAITYPIAVNILVGQLLPASADAHLWKELHAQLEGIANRIKGIQTTFAGTEETFLRMHRQLSYTLMAHPKLALLNARGKARVRLVERLLVATRQFPSGSSPQLTGEYQRHAPTILSAIRDLQFQRIDDGAFRMSPAPADYGATAPTPLAAMQRAVLKLTQEELPREGAGSPAAAAKTAGAGVSGLNTTALKFALKVVLATQIGYLFLSAVRWPGIHTCMLTCIILALPGLGAITHKGVMRLTGAALGSMAALLATVFVIPHLDSITGLLLLSLVVIAVGAWIAAGSPLTDYVGFQLVFCFALALFGGQFGPSTDLTELRDRAVGIVVGVIISLAVYSNVWPEREAGQTASAVADLLHALSRVAAACGFAGNDEHERAQADAWSAIDRLRQLRNHLAFEVRRTDQTTAQWPLDDLLACAHQILLDFDWLAMLAGDERSSDPSRLDAAGKSASDRLQAMAEYAAMAPITPITPPHFDEPMTSTLPVDDIAATTFDSINRQLLQLQQCFSSKP